MKSQKVGWERLLCLLFGFTSTLSAEVNLAEAPLPEPLQIPRVEVGQDMKIDGILNEPFWKQSAVSVNLRGSMDGSPPEETTAVYLAFDDTYLYLAWEVKDHDIRATMTKRDDPIWQEEAVEMFVTAEGLNHYYEFEWNALGSAFDTAVQNYLREDGSSRRFKGDNTWNASGMENGVVRIGTADRDAGWTVEIRISFSDFGRTTPEPGEVWRANFFRINRPEGKRSDNSSWSTVYRGLFHQPVRFGYLIFGP